MKLLIAGIALITLGALFAINQEAQVGEGYESAFLSYSAEFGKAYTTEEEFNYRLSIFKMNAQKVQDHNNAGKSWEAGVNQFSDLTEEEFKKQATGFKKQNNTKKSAIECTVSTTDLKSAIDWRAEGKVTPIKDQQSCGSCWAFSAMGALESEWLVEDDPHRSTKPDFSEQELVDCVYPDGQDTCITGGEMVDAFEYLATHELVW